MMIFSADMDSYFIVSISARSTQENGVQRETAGGILLKPVLKNSAKFTGKHWGTCDGCFFLVNLVYNFT